MSHKLDRKQLQAAVNAIVEHGGPTAAARALKIPKRTLENRLDRAKEEGITANTILGDDPKLLRSEITRLKKEVSVEQKRAAKAEINFEKVSKHILGLREAQLSIPDWTLRPYEVSSPGVPTLFASDWHWDERVKPAQIGGKNEFNRAIAHKRARAMIEVAIYLCSILSPKMDYPGIVFPLGGDMVSGNIHEELQATNEFNSMETVLDVLSILVWQVKELKKVFKRVFLPCVPGNHGRNTKKMWNKDMHATSFDWLIYKLLAWEFRNDPDVTFLIPEGPDALYRTYGHRFLLTHGNQFRGGDGMIGALGPIIRGDHKKRSRNAQINMEYDTMLVAHWHQYIHLTRLIVNGSLKGYDEYAYNNNFGFEEPQQALWVNHPKHGITYRMPVQLDRDKKVQSSGWVEVKGGN